MTILVVDDEIPIIELIKYNLQKEGFTVLTAEKGAQALELARTEKPDLILLDLMLPDMGGFDICRLLQECAPQNESRFGRRCGQRAAGYVVYDRLFGEYLRNCP